MCECLLVNLYKVYLIWCNHLYIDVNIICRSFFTRVSSSSSFRGSLVTRWEAPGGLYPLLVAGQLFSFSTLMLFVGSLTCITVSRMTYTMLVETLNPAHSLTISQRWLNCCLIALFVFINPDKLLSNDFSETPFS